MIQIKSKNTGAYYGMPMGKSSGINYGGNR